jgi:hypothetical protein
MITVFSQGALCPGSVANDVHVQAHACDECAVCFRGKPKAPANRSALAAAGLDSDAENGDGSNHMDDDSIEDDRQAAAPARANGVDATKRRCVAAAKPIPDSLLDDDEDDVEIIAETPTQATNGTAVNGHAGAVNGKASKAATTKPAAARARR